MKDVTQDFGHSQSTRSRSSGTTMAESKQPMKSLESHGTQHAKCWSDVIEKELPRYNIKITKCLFLCVWLGPYLHGRYKLCMLKTKGRVIFLVKEDLDRTQEGRFASKNANLL